MALNLSRRSIKLGNGYFVEGLADKNCDGGVDNSNSYDYRSEVVDKDGDVVDDLLPSDPFDMDIRDTFTAITGWLDMIETNFGSDSNEFATDETEVKRADNPLVAGLNLVWNSASRFQPEVTNLKINKMSNSCGGGGFNGLVMDKELGDDLCDYGLVSDDNVEEFLSFKYEGNQVMSDRAKEFRGCSEIHGDDGDGGSPHEALFFALGYLGVKDLLSVERVCRSLRDAVKSDPLLWRSIHVDNALSYRITDDALSQLTSRAQGSLQCLSLVECLKITDSGLKRVLDSNPGLTKLSVPGCVRLSVDGILFNLKAFKSAGMPGIKHLRIGGLYGVTKKHFEELKFLLGADNRMQLRAHKPRFYRGGQLYLSCDDDCAIDIETCPRCQKLRLVYDCPAESCQGKHHAAQLCRACTLCIARCIHCGCCINDSDYEETFCLDLLCLDCWKQLLKRQEEMGAPSSKHTIFHQETRYLMHKWKPAIECTLECQAVESRITTMSSQLVEVEEIAPAAEL